MKTTTMTPDIKSAIADMRKARDTRVRWAYYLEEGGKAPKEVGSISHHKAMVAKYDNALECLMLLAGLVNWSEGKVKPIEKIREELKRKRRA